jgi:hypothetical protein
MRSSASAPRHQLRGNDNADECPFCISVLQSASHPPSRTLQKVFTVRLRPYGLCGAAGRLRGGACDRSPPPVLEPYRRIRSPYRRCADRQRSDSPVRRHLCEQAPYGWSGPVNLFSSDLVPPQPSDPPGPEPGAYEMSAPRSHDIACCSNGPRPVASIMHGD